MYSLEDCYGNECGWAAYGGVNSWFTVYKGDNYKYPPVIMHEIGHNLNLAHSGGSDGKTYSDHSCLMGNPYFLEDVSAMCYNPAKSYQLSQQGSWYSNRIVTWNSGSSGSKALTQRMVGIADYGNNPDKLPVVVKLETGSSDDLFVGFNRVRGINSAAKDAVDRVTVMEQGANGAGYSTSITLAILSAGQSHTVNNWQSSGKKMVITVNSITTGSNPWVAEVEFNFNNASTGTPKPTPRPTPRPTPKPTPKPVSTACYLILITMCVRAHLLMLFNFVYCRHPRQLQIPPTLHRHDDPLHRLPPKDAEITSARPTKTKRPAPSTA